MDYANRLKADPENVDVICNRMVVAIGMGKPEASLKDFDRIIARHPDSPYASSFRGPAPVARRQGSATGQGGR